MTLKEIGTMVARTDTAMAQAMTLAVLHAYLDGSAYGWE